MAKRSLIGLDIGSKAIKAVELSEVGERVHLTGFVQAEITSATQVNEVLAQLANKGGFRTSRVVTAVSGRSVIVRYVNMPRMGEEELKNAMKYEAGKYIPFEVEDVILDCHRLEDGGDMLAKEMRVVLVAVKRSLIDSHVGVLEQAGLVPHIIDVDSFALGNAYDLRARLNPQAAAKDKVVALIDVGAYKTNINIVKGTNSFFTREIYLAGNDFTDALQKKLNLDAAAAEQVKRAPDGQLEDVKEIMASAIDDLCHEIHLSFDFFENQFDQEVQAAYLCGGSARLVGLDEAFQRTFGDRVSLQPWNPLDFVDTKLDRISPQQLQQNAPQLAIAIGLASRILD